LAGCEKGKERKQEKNEEKGKREKCNIPVNKLGSRYPWPMKKDGITDTVMCYSPFQKREKKRKSPPPPKKKQQDRHTQTDCPKSLFSTF